MRAPRGRHTGDRSAQQLDERSVAGEERTTPPPHPPFDGEHRPAEAAGLIRVLRWVYVLMLLLVLLGFAAVVYSFTFADALCCADDASIAVAAKNLWLGNGYATSVPYFGGTALSPFDPAISTGPTLVVPAAGLMHVFGAEAWVPGFTTATVSGLLLVLLFLVVPRSFSALRRLSFLVLFVLLGYSVTATSYFSQWYSLLGEVPAALLAIIGMVVLTPSPLTRKRLVVAFLCFGLAAVTKLLAVLAFVPVVAWLLYRIKRDTDQRRARSLDLVWAGLALAAPTAVFEVCKLVSLGFDRYRQNVADTVAFVTEFSTGVDESASQSYLRTALAHARINVRMVSEGLGTPLLVLLAVIAASSVLIFTTGAASAFVRRLYALLMTSGLTQIAYYVLLSRGTPRYALIGVLLCFGALSCVVLIRLTWYVSAAVVTLVALSVAAPEPSLSRPIETALSQGFAPNQRLEHLESAAAFLDALPEEDRFVGNWWASVVDLEYMLTGVGHFIAYDDVPADEQRGRLLVRNTVWSDFASSDEFRVWQARCPEVLFDEPPFLVTRCPG